jgi:NADPH-dependent curcumin reductase CurA
MADTTNRRWVVAETPAGTVTTEHFRAEQRPVEALRPDQILVQVRRVSVEPANAVWMKGPTYMPQVMPGEMIPAFGVGIVIASASPLFVAGDVVEGSLGWQDFAVVDAARARKRDADVPLDDHVGLLGISSVTGYYGMLEIGRVRAGETVLVSAAGGAVGGVAAQIGKIAGCRVIGIAGGADKCAWLQAEYGLDATIDYRAAAAHAGGLTDAIKAAAPEGVDFFFDNTGGPILEGAIPAMRIGGRIGLCGVVAQLNDLADTGIRGVPQTLIVRRIAMLGFLLSDYDANQRRAAEKQLQQWAQDGRLKVATHALDGFERIPEALTDVLTGRNRGKTMVRL